MSKYTVRIAFLNVGQGDTIVISIPETKEAIVVDCIDVEGVLAYFEQEQIKHFRGLILTHLHADHYQGAVQLLNNCEKKDLPCERVLFNWPPKTTQQALELVLKDEDDHDTSANEKIEKNQRASMFWNFKRQTVNYKKRFGSVNVQFGNHRLPLSGAIADQVDLLHPSYSEMDDLIFNNISAVLKISGLNSSALLMGDLEPNGFAILQSKSVNLQCDVLKFPHHGGAWELTESENLLNQLSPSMVVISVGCATDLGKYKDKSNKYGHPNESVFESLKNWAIKHQTFQLLCTQATSICHPGLFEESTRLPIRDAIAKELGISVLDKNSCPCAGTVIVELGQRAQLIQPKKAVHQQIIKTYFNKHQCYNI